MAGALLNQGHIALSAFEPNGIVSTIITQNFDGLHHATGSQTVSQESS